MQRLLYLLYLLYPLLAIFLAGCSAFGQDNRGAIALATLYDTAPAPARATISETPEPVFTSALGAKFPPGTTVEALTGFVTRLGGQCAENADPKTRERILRCDMVESTSLCIKNSLHINAVIEEHRIQRVEAYHWFDGC